MMVEALVEGDVCHVDGLVVDGQLIWCFPARYVGTCLSWQVGGHVGSHTLPAGAPLSKRLVAFTVSVLDAFPPAGGQPVPPGGLRDAR